LPPSRCGSSRRSSLLPRYIDGVGTSVPAPFLFLAGPAPCITACAGESGHSSLSADVALRATKPISRVGVLAQRCDSHLRPYHRRGRLVRALASAADGGAGSYAASRELWPLSPAATPTFSPLLTSPKRTSRLLPPQARSLRGPRGRPTDQSERSKCRRGCEGNRSHVPRSGIRACSAVCGGCQGSYESPAPVAKGTSGSRSVGRGPPRAIGLVARKATSAERDVAPIPLALRRNARSGPRRNARSGHRASTTSSFQHQVTARGPSRELRR
jgi:hypothetical protein